MVSSGDIPIGLLSLILLLAPGLLGIELYFYFADRKSSMSRIKWIAYSALVSTASLIILYLLSPITEGALLPSARTMELLLHLPDAAYFGSKTMGELLAFYSEHIIFIGLIAYSAAYIDRWRREEELDRREAWRFAFDEGRAETNLIEVVLRDGTIIRGDFIREAWDSSRRELYLDNPLEVEYDLDKDGERTEDTIDMGRSIFLQENAIARVLFLQEDPQSGRMDDIEESSELSQEFLDLIRQFPEEEQSTLFELLEEGEEES